MKITTHLRFLMITACLIFFLFQNTYSQSKITSQPNSITFTINASKYKSTSIPNLFNALITNHTYDFYLIDSIDYLSFCKSNNILKTDSLNIRNFYTVKILHELFTSQTASNCSKGLILDIPYFWHWCQDNPRHKIYFTSSNKLLKNCKPPKEFSRYSSYADIDRTPYLFLSDMVSNVPNYYSKSCDTFSTFGWCSEREMAFVALMTTLNYNGKIKAENYHSWSEFIIPMKNIKNEQTYFNVIVDNTFNSIDWVIFKLEQKNEWETQIGSVNQSKWYNTMASSLSEINRINCHLVNEKASDRIENKIVKYLMLNMKKNQKG
ncbi:MAG: hypothetical protein IPH57_10005 [Saprospiraceae bacterium]|nr:hypothetical protein [Saprospiraceae bacterium]